ncbi:MAG: GerMN domain-containing protein [Proteobacteria bacterium]|nr:GerMN domain-containing protein [Pseudomonadota bacterium]
MSKNLSIVALMLVISSCSLIRGNRDQPEKEASLVEPKNESTKMTLFYPKLSGTGVEKIEVEVEDNQKNTNLWFSQLIVQLAEAKDKETMAVFPEKIEFYSLFLDKDILYLDFSNSIQKEGYPNIQIEQFALQAFLMSIKVNFPFVQQVKILSEHEDTQVVFGHTYAQQPFSLKEF